MIWYFLNNIILQGHYCIYNAANVHLRLRQSIKLLIIEHQKGHTCTSYEERAGTFSCFQKCGGGAPCPSAPPPCSAALVALRSTWSGRFVIASKPTASKLLYFKTHIASTHIDSRLLFFKTHIISLVRSERNRHKIV